MSDLDDQQGPTGTERAVLQRGLREWGGSAIPTAAVARFLGFRSALHMQEWTSVVAGKIAAGELLSQEEWGTSLACTELVFVSERFGSGLDWSTVAGFTDEETIAVLRSIQHSLPRWRPARGGE